MIRSVWFDVGETLVDETREYGTWADWLSVPRHTFSAVFGAVIATGRDYREVFQRFQPGFDLELERARRSQVGQEETFGEDDLYPDARRCLQALRSAGLQVGVAGNQTARAEAILRSLELPADVIATSSSWGAEKPGRAFFDRLVDRAGYPPQEVVYVGDRIDNDLRPAQAVGLATALVRRGPWGLLMSDREIEQRCLWVLDGLDSLAGLVAQHNEKSAS